MILKEGNLKEKITAPRSSGLANHSYRNVISSGASLQDSSAQNVVDEFFQPVKVNLLLPLHFLEFNMILKLWVVSDFFFFCCSQLFDK